MLVILHQTIPLCIHKGTYLNISWKIKDKWLVSEYSCKSIIIIPFNKQHLFDNFWFWKLGFRSHDNMIGLEWCKFTKIYKESHTQSDNILDILGRIWKQSYNILGILGRIWKLLSQFNVHIGGTPYRYVVVIFARIESRCDLGWRVSAVECC